MANWWEEVNAVADEEPVKSTDVQQETPWYEQVGIEEKPTTAPVIEPQQPIVDSPLEGSAALTGFGIGAGAGRVITRRVGAPKTPEQKRKAELAAELRKKGYVVPPRQDPTAGTISRAMEVASGSEKLYQDVATKNIDTALASIKRDLKLPEDATLTRDTILKVREEASKPYEAVSQLRWKIKTPKEYRNALEDIGRTIDTKLNEMPELFKKAPEIEALLKTIDVPTMSMEAAVSAVKTLRNRAEANLKSPNVEVGELGKAQMKAADTIDEMVSQTLVRHGKGKLHKDYEQGRKIISKTYDIAPAINETTGELDLAKLGRELKGTEDLTGGLKEAAEFSRAFPRAATLKDPSRMTLARYFDRFFPLPMAASGMMFAPHSPTAGVAMIAAGGIPTTRAAARGVLSGPIYQRGLSRLPGPAKFLGPAIGAVGGAAAGALSQVEENQKE